MIDFKDKIIIGTILALIAGLLGFSSQILQDNYYNKPRLVVDTTYQYSNIENISIGNILVTNIGSTADEDIVLIVNDKVDKSEIKIDGAHTDNEVEIGDNETKFVIRKLNPTDSATIAFSSISKKSNFDIVYSSKSQKIEEPMISDGWWDLNLAQILFILSIGSFTFLIGVFRGKQNRGRVGGVKYKSPS